jgi:iron complex outermembrane recepter protein
MTRLCLLFAFAFYSVYANSQFTLSGEVTDDNGEKLAGANILIEGTTKGTTTDFQGKYKIPDIESGTYKVVMSYVGYETIKREIIVKNDVVIVFAAKPSITFSDEVVVKGLRASANDPITKTEVKKSDFEKQNIGQDLPVLLSLTPSSVTTSDAGAGVGYTGIRIRGADASRTNVTINGVPLNDAESQGVFWVDIPDFAENVENIQIQRGVGTSTYGTGSFGAGMNLQSTSYNPLPYSEVKLSGGSFGTFKNTIGIGTGLLNSKFTFDARVSMIKSEGFIDRSSSELQAYFLTAGYYSANDIIKVNIFGGKEQTYQAWNGIPKVKLNNDTKGIQDYIADNYYSKADSENMVNSNPRTYNFFTYKNQTDNYNQNHYQVHYLRKINNMISANITFHYTRGLGYYEEYKPSQNLAAYQLEEIHINDSVISNTDIIRRLYLDNDFYGLIGSLNYSGKETDISIGGALNEYYGRHYGRVIWSTYASNGAIDHEWYHGKGIKDDLTLYLKINHKLSDDLYLYCDMQHRNIQYDIKGTDKNIRNIGQTHTFTFLNPKVGATFKLDDFNSMYVFYGISQKEPTRANYVDRKPGNSIPKPEKLYNFEMGYKLVYSNITAGLNYYMMVYTDQLVLTGALNDVGDPLMMNVNKSSRQGIELEISYNKGEWFKWMANATISSNKIRNFNDSLGVYLDDGTYSSVFDKTYRNVDIAFSPSVIVANTLSFSFSKNIFTDLQSKYVGKQFIDNTQSDERMLKGYFVNNLVIKYLIKTKFIKYASFSLIVNNLFNSYYLTNGWVYRYKYAEKIYTIDGYFPQAGINFLAGLKVNF